MSAPTFGWTSQIVGVQWPSLGWFGLAFSAQWQGQNAYSDQPKIINPAPIHDITLTTPGLFPSPELPLFRVFPPNVVSKTTQTTEHGFNTVQETMLGALLEGQPFIFEDVFTGENAGDIEQQAVQTFAAEAVARGFYPDLATALEEIFVQSLSDVAPPDVSRIDVPTTTIVTSVASTVNLFMYADLGRIKRVLGLSQPTFDFSMQIGSAPVNGTYDWTATGHTFKARPPWTMTSSGVPQPVWWDRSLSSDTTTLALDWSIDLHTLKILLP